MIVLHQMLMFGYGYGLPAPATCPSYLLVELQQTATAYSPPAGSAAELTQLPCPYTPPSVI